MKSMLITLPLSPSEVCILLNGDPDGIYKLEQAWKHYKHIIICDGAWAKLAKEFDSSLYANDARIMVLGDGDSLSDVDKPASFILEEDQSTTDFEKAINKVLQIFQKEWSAYDKVNIDVYWANGGDIDHTLGNLAMACKFSDQLTCHFYTHNQYARYVNSNVTIHGGQGCTFSIFPFPKCTISCTEGLLYPMINYEMQVYTQQSLRNQISEEFAIVEMVLSENSHDGYVLFIEQLI